MTAEVSKNDAPTFLWMNEVERQFSVRWAENIEDLILFFIYYDAESVNFCLVVSADSKLMYWDCVKNFKGFSEFQGLQLCPLLCFLLHGFQFLLKIASSRSERLIRVLPGFPAISQRLLSK